MEAESREVRRYEYYEALKVLAREIRDHYGLNTPRVLRSDLRRVYRDQKIRIYPWKFRFKRLRGAYIYDSGGAAVLINVLLPVEPVIFTLGHELKHHLTDRTTGLSYCDTSNADAHLEIGAEIFAAELIYPQADFVAALVKMGITSSNYQPEALVKLKARVKTTLSYAAMAKRTEFLGIAPWGAHVRVKWRSLEERLFGPPVYKRILARRRAIVAP